MKGMKRLGKFIFLVLIFTQAGSALAATSSFEISGWIPYWRKEAGVAEALAHLKTFNEINLFGYTVKNDGSLFDAMKINDAPWPKLIAAAKAAKVKIIPTVMWSDGNAIHRVLSDPTLRANHIKAIVKMVNDGGFDGVDIDYESKLAETSPYFSLFLKELYTAMGQKWVMCNLEPRTPLSSRYDTIPADIQYANDFKEINKYCDRVKIMAYDQGTVDLRLNEVDKGPYRPVADPKWVEKLVTLAAKDIKKSKIIIGVPTYGYESELQVNDKGKYSYKLLWSFNPNYALNIAKSLGGTPWRNRAGEMSLIYFATSTDSTNKMRLLWWSDASAIKDKITLARKLGVRGVGIFKIDGGADPNMWTVLK